MHSRLVWILIPFLCIVSSERLGYNYDRPNFGNNAGFTSSLSHGNSGQSIGIASHAGLAPSLNLGSSSYSSSFGNNAGIAPSLNLGSSGLSAGIANSAGLAPSLSFGSASHSAGFGSSAGIAPSLTIGNSGHSAGIANHAALGGSGNLAAFGNSAGLAPSLNLGNSGNLAGLASPALHFGANHGLLSAPGIAGIAPQPTYPGPSAFASQLSTQSFGLAAPQSHLGIHGANSFAPGGGLGFNPGNLGAAFAGNLGAQLTGGGILSGQASIGDGISQVAEAPIVNTHFYLHSAPEDHSEITKTKRIKIGRPQKNYRVVFIKAPSSSASNAQIAVDVAPQEEKTVIYVLSQKQHEINVNSVVDAAPSTPSKPEVFFIKYKTPEEALHAQQKIQAQYASLGGTSQVSDEGVAPLTSIIGSLGQGSSSDGSAFSSFSAQGTADLSGFPTQQSFTSGLQSLGPLSFGGPSGLSSISAHQSFTPSLQISGQQSFGAATGIPHFEHASTTIGPSIVPTLPSIGHISQGAVPTAASFPSFLSQGSTTLAPEASTLALSTTIAPPLSGSSLHSGASFGPALASNLGHSAIGSHLSQAGKETYLPPNA